MTKSPVNTDVFFDGVPPELLLDPLEYLYVEHGRQRMAYILLQQQSQLNRPDSEIVMTLKLFLSHDCGQHIADEEADLFPLLRKRARPEDEIESLLQQLSAEHAQQEAELEGVIPSLDKMIAGQALASRSNHRKKISAFTASARRHLAIENGTLLPIARLRLTAKDLEVLGERMAARRGLDFRKVLAGQA